MYRLEIPAVYVVGSGGKVTDFLNNTVGKKKRKKVFFSTKHIKKAEKQDALLTENNNVFRINLCILYLLYNLY